ncbi:mechanosensitive ion channel family protein [Novosphingobium resinovorum]
MMRLIRRTPFEVGADRIGAIVSRLSNILPALIVQGGIGTVSGLPMALPSLVHSICAAIIIVSLALSLTGVLTLANEQYQRRPEAGNRPIKGYVQVAKLLVYGATAILVIAALMDQSPLLLLSGLGAMAAVLMLVFKDTILSLVASVQITSNDMIRVGDWIEMPKLDANGDVIDIALHTVKVQNFDKTITTIPTHRLITDSFRNWRGMSESGGRRIMRSLMIDQNSVRFLGDADIGQLSRFAVFRAYLDDRQGRISAWNRRHAGSDGLNARRLTNIGTFRAYVLAYLRSLLHSRGQDHAGPAAGTRRAWLAPADLCVRIHDRLGEVRGHSGRHLRPSHRDHAGIRATPFPEADGSGPYGPRHAWL